MFDKKIKHLEFIQNTISRMAGNSFIVKGWLITLISALYALAAKDANMDYVLISYFATPAFWSMNGYFLSQERRFRNLYNAVRNKKEENIDFNMDTQEYQTFKNSWLSSMFSIDVFPIYLLSMAITIGIMFYIK